MREVGSTSPLEVPDHAWSYCGWFVSQSSLPHLFDYLERSCADDKFKIYLNGNEVSCPSTHHRVFLSKLCAYIMYDAVQHLWEPLADIIRLSLHFLTDQVRTLKKGKQSSSRQFISKQLQAQFCSALSHFSFSLQSGFCSSSLEEADCPPRKIVLVHHVENPSWIRDTNKNIICIRYMYPKA